MQGVGPGSVLAGRYAVTMRTSAGEHHERWRASDRTLEREVVLVCFAARSAVAAPALDAARRAAGVEDPRLVRVLDVGTDHGVSFIVEEPLTGATPLAHLLHSGGLPAEEVRRLVGEAATALEKARLRGLHHQALTPWSLLRLPDGEVKVRGLATEAALTDADVAADEQASRLDAIGLVKLIYAGLTARWPHAEPVGDGPSGDVGLETAPAIVGGVAAPSEISVGVPQDLDLICRLSLSGDGGPTAPGDLAAQIAPWPSTPPSFDGATAIGLQPVMGGHDPGRAAGGRSRRAGLSGLTARAGAAGPTPRAGAAVATGGVTGGAAASGHGSAPAGGSGSDISATQLMPTLDSMDDASETAPQDRRAGAGVQAAAGAAAAGVAGVAGSIGDKVGSFARAAADKAAARAAERRAAHDQLVPGEDVALDDALEEGPVDELEPPLPLLANVAPERPSNAQSRIALAIVAALVLVALVVGIQNVAKIGQHDGQPQARPTVTVTAAVPTAPTQGATSQPPTTTATTTAPAAPITIAGGKGLDLEDGTEADQNVRLVHDGDLDTSWRSRWYGSPDYNGKEGLGVVLDFEEPAVVSEVDLTLPVAQDVTVYAADEESLEGAQEIGTVSKAGTTTIKAPAGLELASKLLVWVTTPAPAEAPTRYRAQISEVVVR